jgi:hypothetical protein
MRCEAVGAAIFVDDKRHLRPVRLHAAKKVGGKHRRGHEKDLADNARFAKRLLQIDAG